MKSQEESTPNSRARLLEYAEFIEEQIAHARSKIKSNDLFRALLWILTVALGILFLEIVLDHTIELPLTARRAILFAGLITGLIYSWLRIIQPMLLQINQLYAAKSIETIDPKFKNSLINYLQIRENSDKVAPSVLAQMEARAVSDLSQVNVDGIVDSSSVTRLSYALAALIVGFCLYSWMTPKSLLDSAKRAFLADLQRPTNTRFTNVRPGDQENPPKAITGMPMEFTVETLGAQPDRVKLYTSRDGGKTFAETEMNQGSSFADPWSTTIEKIPGELVYYMAGGDGRTRTYRLEAKPVAIVEKVLLDYDFPEYTGVQRRESIEEGNVEALKGTWITITAQTNQPAKSGYLDFKPLPPVPLMPVAGSNNQLTGRFLVQENGQYSVRFTSTDGQENPDPVLYDIKVVNDLAPTARFIRPESPTQRPANARVPLVIEASDDFGLTSIQLHVHRNGEILQSAQELKDPNSDTDPKQIQKTVSLDLQNLSVKPGEKIQYWLTLRDNCDLQPNKFETPQQIIEILDAVSEPQREELAQNEMAQAQEQTGQNPMNDSPQNSQDDPSNSDQNSEQSSSGKQNQNDSADKSEQKEDQKNGQGKSSKGDQTEAAEPDKNAKSGGKEAPNATQQPDNSSQSKNQKSGQTEQQGDSGSSNQSSDENKSQKGGSGQSNPDSNQAEGNKQNSPDTNHDSDKTKGLNKSKPEQTSNEKSGEKQSGEDQSGQKNDGSGSETSPAGSRDSSETGGEKSSQPSDQNGKTENTQDSKNQSQSDDPSQGSQPSRSLTEQDREKLDKLRDALGLNQDQSPTKPESSKSGSEVDEKNSEDKQGQQNAGQDGKADTRKPEENGKESASPGMPEKNDPSNNSDPQSTGESNPNQAESGKPEQNSSNSKSPETAAGNSADQKLEDSSNKSSSGKTSDPFEKGSDQDKSPISAESGSDDRRSPSEKDGGDKTGENQKSSSNSPMNQLGGDQKQGDQQKGQQDGKNSNAGSDTQKSDGPMNQKGGDQKQGDQQKGQQDGKNGKSESGDQPGKEKGETSDGDSQKPEEKNQNKGGALSQDAPKSGGMRSGEGPTEAQPDQSVASPRAVEPENPATTTDLSTQQKADQRLLKRLREMVDRNEISKEIEDSTGLSREEIDQFVRKFEAPPETNRTVVRDGETMEISTDSGSQRPDRKIDLPPNLSGKQVISRIGGNSQISVDDSVQGNLEGNRSRIPAALRSRFEAYQKGLSRAGRTSGTAITPNSESGSTSNVNGSRSGR